MNEVQESIRKLLDKREDADRKNISINLDNETLLKVDRLTKILSRMNPSRSISRNSIIETALNAFIKESAIILKDEHGIILEKYEEPEEETNSKDVMLYDLIVLPAHNEGFNETFLGEKVWYSFRIKEERIDKIKYIAIYRAAPISGITHYAKVGRISQYKNTNKKIAYFDGPPISLDHTVKLGSSNANAFRAPRYTQLSRLLNAQEVSDLF